MAEVEAKSEVLLVKKSLPWLKRLQGALDDDDSSDSSSQPTEATPKKAERKKPEKEEGAGSRRRVKKKRLRLQEGDSGSDDASSEGSGDAKERKRRRAKKSVKTRRKRSMEVGAKDSNKAEPRVDSTKGKAAALREQRVQKLHALRVTNGEHGKMAAFKLKRQESAEVFREKERNRMRAIRAVRDAQKVSTGAEADVEDEGKPRRRPRSRAGADKGTADKSAKRKRRAAALKKEDSKTEQTDSPTVDEDKVSASVQPDRDDESEGNSSAGAKAVPVELRKHEDIKMEGLVASPESVKLENKEGGSSAATRNTPVKPEGSVGESYAAIKGTYSTPATTETSVKAEVNISEGAKSECTTQDMPEDADTTKRSPASTFGDALVKPSKPEEQVKTESPVEIEGTAEQMKNEGYEARQAGSPTVRTDDGKKINGGKKEELLLDMMPIPRKTPKEGTSNAPSPRAESFVIPKRTFAKTDIAGSKVVAQKERIDSAVPRPGVAKRSLDPPAAVAMLPLPSPESSPTLPNAKSIRPQRKRTKNSVPVKSALLSTQDRALMRLSRKRNSILMAAAELATQAPDIKSSRKGSATRMVGYEVYDVAGKLLPDLIARLSCATKREMALNRESYTDSFFGVSRLVSNAKGTSSSSIDECGENDLDARKINCYEELHFERPEDREFFQRKMYGTVFVPQILRGWITLIARNVRFERKSTGIRFNQDRDREEFAATLSKRYTFKKAVPRCEIPRENWQKLIRNQPGTVYLHYYNREDAERASDIFRDDLGQPLQIQLKLKAGAKIKISSSPASRPNLQRAPRRSCSSERSAPEPSPLSSQNGSARNTPSWRRERQPASKSDRFSRYDHSAPPPPAPWPRGEAQYGPSVSGNKRSRALLARRSRSRSRSKSFHSQHYDSSGQESRAMSGALKQSDTKPSVAHKRARPNGVNGNDSSIFHTHPDTPARKRARMLPCSPRRSPTSGQDRHMGDETTGCGPGVQEDAYIRSGSVAAPSSPLGASDGGDNRRAPQRAKSPSRRWQQESHNASAHSRRDSFSDNSRDRSTGSATQYRSSRPDRDSSKQISGSRPRASPPGRGLGGGRGDWYKERRGSREFGHGGAYDGNSREQRMHSIRGREGYNDRSGGESSRPRK
ncbi:hypothetical protein PHYPSEUDO_010718 [Phytophthora pseudosyringae]|uniref:Uncharacterized protein n=1 Tax=Phytophthora pseudosyringae TaxID=221518 RepID=A0A8T1VAE6_9STRA|nr:hypothetical protein PHYPSEUDO_010718 [Phytophthora pseudosyringae]